MAAILADNIFKLIFLNENGTIQIQISLKFIPNGLIDNISPLVQIMAWQWTGYKPLSQSIVTWFADAYMGHTASVN